jgi:hypothetical protein
MKASLRIALMIALLLQTGATEKSDAPAAGDQILFERPVGGDGQTFAIVRGPDRDRSLFQFWKDPVVDGTTKLYEIRAELHRKDAAPLLLNSYVRIEDGPKTDKGVVVLDLMVRSGEFIVCLAEGDRLRIWHIAIFDSHTSIDPGPAQPIWSKAEAPRIFTGESLTATLGETESGHLTVTIIEKPRHRHSALEEVNPTDHTYRLSRQWQEQ